MIRHQKENSKETKIKSCNKYKVIASKVKWVKNRE